MSLNDDCGMYKHGWYYAGNKELTFIFIGLKQDVVLFKDFGISLSSTTIGVQTVFIVLIISSFNYSCKYRLWGPSLMQSVANFF